MGRVKETSGLWWLGWILLTILSFFGSCAFWTPFLGTKYGDMSRPGMPLLWVTAVFGTWMILLVPLIIVMYFKVDKAYEDARLAREAIEKQKRSALTDICGVAVDPFKRRLSLELQNKLRRIPETLPKGQVVTVVLKNGSKFPNVFIQNKQEILGIYGAQTLPFEANQIADVLEEPLDWARLQHAEGWLRLDKDK